MQGIVAKLFSLYCHNFKQPLNKIASENQLNRKGQITAPMGELSLIEYIHCELCSQWDHGPISLVCFWSRGGQVHTVLCMCSKKNIFYIWPFLQL